MTIGPDHSTIASTFNQLTAILADATQLLAAIKLLIAEQSSEPQFEPNPEDQLELMRLKDDGCPNGE
jgi:hypothetical protein